jgi:amino acid transporter
MKELKISTWVLSALFAISIIIFGIFFFVGFDTPWEDNPKMKDPQFIDLLLWFNYIMIGCTLVITIISAIMQIVQGSSIANEKGIAGHTNTIAWGVLVIALVAGFFIGKGDTEELLANGKSWNPADPENVTDNILAGVSMISIIILTLGTFIATLISIIAGALKK